MAIVIANYGPAFLLLLTEWAHRRPMLAIFSIILWNIIIIVVRFGARIWAELGDPITDYVEFLLRCAIFSAG